LGFTGQVIGLGAVIPDQTAPIEARFSATGRFKAGRLPRAGFSWQGAKGRAGASF